ncbi:MAG: hypothetical protein MK214_16995 [Thalassotalea sp.]|jgi:hypothetical protein|nr:hypothetical protein [Thalassotalea sp.]
MQAAAPYREVIHPSGDRALIYRALMFALIWHVIAFPVAWIGLHPFNVIPFLENTTYSDIQLMWLIRGTWFVGLFSTFIASSFLSELIIKLYKPKAYSTFDNILVTAFSALLIAIVFVPSEPKYVPDHLSYSIGVVLLFLSFTANQKMTAYILNKLNQNSWGKGA